MLIKRMLRTLKADEKAEALEKWAQRLNSIVSPPAKVPDKKIVPLRKRRR